MVLAAQKSPMESQVSVVTYASRASLPRILPYTHPAGAAGWCGLLLPDVMQPILWWLREHKEKANDMDNSHTCGNLHRARNQRLPAGRVLILGSDLVRAARSPAARSLSCPHHRPARRVGWSDPLPVSHDEADGRQHGSCHGKQNNDHYRRFRRRRRDVGHA